MANDNILHFPGRLEDVPQLEGAEWSDLENFIVLAKRKDGTPYFASTNWTDTPMLNWLADKFKQRLLEDG